MADIEKVIKGLEICKERNYCSPECPYYEITDDCNSAIAEDALAILKEQQERIETLESLRRIEQEGR